MAAKCPREDMLSGDPDDVIEAKCSKCGTLVEFFKTEASRRCPGCRERVLNPKVAAAEDKR